jgi:hypothetical protein
VTGTCVRCGEAFVRKERGRPRKWCKDACKVAGWRGAKREQVVLTVAELARRLGVEPEEATALLSWCVSAGFARRLGSGWVPTARGRELGGQLDEEARSLEVPLTEEDLRALTPRTGPRPGVRRRELVAA